MATHLAAAEPAAPARAASSSLDYLVGRLGLIEAQVRAAVAVRRSVDADPEDRFRGLYISDADVDALLTRRPAGAATAVDEQLAAERARLETQADQAEGSGAEIRLRRLARAFELEELELELLLIALAPDIDPRFERLYGYLHDDVSRRRASTGLALELAGGGAVASQLASRFQPSGRLFGGGLLMVEELDRPFLTRPLRVPDRVTLHLLGDDTPDPLLAGVMADAIDVELGDPGPLDRGLAGGSPLCYLRQRTGAAASALGVTALRRHGMPALALDLERLELGEAVEPVARAAIREARLIGGGLLVGPVEVLAERGAHAVRAFAEAACPVILFGARSWDPRWGRAVPLVVEAPIPSVEERAAVWRSALNGDTPAGAPPAIGPTHFRLTPEQVARAAESARRRAMAEARPLTPDDLTAGARAQNAAGLERLARRIEPRVDWDDLVLPADVLAHLRELTARVRQRDRVLDEWHMGAGSAKGRGITALFAGDSGTGKTLSAEVVAGSVGLDLYVIDLSTVVDKYIGETEKNLDRIFTEADRVNGVLLFDEADAIFGKRSEVKDARDRYANVEVAYLLQRMELFDGLAILTTNLRANVDEAFLRRLDAIVDFPMPEADDRRRLWEGHLARGAPISSDVDLDFLASAFRLSGGNIRNIVLSAAYLAAEEERPIEMPNLIRATEREYRKLGRLLVEAEFGPYFRPVET